MSHPENQSTASRAVSQFVDAERLALKMAEAVVERHVAGLDSSRSSEPYRMAIPSIASRIAQNLGNIASMVGQLNDRELDRVFSAYDDVLHAAKEALARIGEEMGEGA